MPRPPYQCWRTERPDERCPGRDGAGVQHLRVRYRIGEVTRADLHSASGHISCIETLSVRTVSRVTTAALVLAVTACSRAEQPAAGDSAAAAAAATPAAEPAVSILGPADGDTVSQPFTVRLGATGVEVIAASGISEAGKGHHHLVIDGDAPSDSLPLPAAPVVIHMGNGATERVIDSLPPGPHRIIAIFAGGDHVPMTTVKRDTLMVIVR